MLELVDCLVCFLLALFAACLSSIVFLLFDLTVLPWDDVPFANTQSCYAQDAIPFSSAGRSGRSGERIDADAPSLAFDGPKSIPKHMAKSS